MSSESSRAAQNWKFAVLLLVVGAAVFLLGVLRFDFPSERGTLVDVRIEGPSGPVFAQAFAPNPEFCATTPVAGVKVSRDSRLLPRLASNDRLREIRDRHDATSPWELSTDARISSPKGASIPVLASSSVYGEFARVEVGEGPPLADAASNFRPITMLVACGSAPERLSLWAALRATNGAATLTVLLREFLQRLGWLGPILFVALYLVASVVAFPGAILTIAGGVAFGLWKGTLVVTVAANVGASAAFLFARLVARSAIERTLPARLQAFNRDLETNGLRTILFLRLVPFFPFNVINYLCGVSRLRYRDFLVGSLVGMVPGTFLWILAALSATSLSLANPLTWAPFALVFLMLLTPRLIEVWKARRCEARASLAGTTP